MASVLIAACVAACGPKNETPKGPVAPHASALPSTSASANVAGGPRGPGPMGGVKPTQMGARLAEVGLDVRHLPPLERLTPEQRFLARQREEEEAHHETAGEHHGLRRRVREPTLRDRDLAICR